MAIDGRKRSLEVDELELEAVEVFALPCDLAALLLERVAVSAGSGASPSRQRSTRRPASAGVSPRRRSARISVSRERSASLYSR